MDASLDMKTRNKLATCCLAICLMLSIPDCRTRLIASSDFNGSFQSGEETKSQARSNAADCRSNAGYVGHVCLLQA